MYFLQSAEYTVSHSSKPSAVAGAIAARARERVDPLLLAIGEDAVCNAALAICRSRLYLEEDKLDIRFVAVEERVRKEQHNGSTKMLSSTKLKIYVEDVE